MTTPDNGDAQVIDTSGQPKPPSVTTTTTTTPTPTAGSDEKEGQKPEPVSKPAGGSTQTINTEILEAQSLNFGEQINQIKNAVFTSAGAGRVRAFKFQQDAYGVRKQQQELIANLFVADPAHVANLKDRLSKKRILILSGEPGIGKRTLAIYLASLITAEIQNGRERPQTYFVDPLDRHVRVEMTKILDGRQVPKHTFLIMRNACERGNPDLFNFLSQLNRFSLAEYAEKLSKTNSYLVLTIATADADRLKLNLAEDDVHHRVNNLSRDLLAKGLERKLAHSSQEVETAAEHLALMRGKQNYLIDSLKNMPRLAAFVDYYVSTSATNGGPLDLDEALRRFDDVGYWFQKYLSKDFEQWSFTLSLGLAHCLGDSEDVSWFGFENLRRSVLSWLKSDSQLFPEEPERRKTNRLDHKEKRLRLLDDDFLDVCRAEIVKDQNSLSDLIVFRSRNYPGRLWDVMLRHYRGILRILLPHLAATAENAGTRNDVLHRALCARIIGRIGEIDPERITADLMDDWMNSDDISHQALVGALYEGILASNSERYRNCFLERLKALTNAHSGDEDQDEEKNWDSNDVMVALVDDSEENDKKLEKKHMLALSAVYAQIGDRDFDLAMKGLERIAQNKLVGVIENVQRVGRLMERTESAFRQRLSKQEARELLPVFQEMVSDLIGRLYNPQRYTFAGVQCAFWSLCLRVDPITVFAELRRWIKTSNQATGALVALMFLSDEGIAAHLESQKVEIGSEEAGASERHSCNEILAALKSEASVVELARFLVTLFESFTVPFVFPSRLMQYLQESLMLRLKIWAEEALPIETCRHVVEQLFVELMRVHQGVLFDPVFRLLHEKNFGKKHPELKKAFVDAVLWQAR